MCNNKATERAKFIIWVLAHNKLSTLDRLSRCGIAIDSTYKLFLLAQESHQQLILECKWVQEFREKVFEGLVDTNNLLIQQECKRVSKIC